jgi:hypothetical protein
MRQPFGAVENGKFVHLEERIGLDNEGKKRVIAPAIRNAKPAIFERTCAFATYLTPTFEAVLSGIEPTSYEQCELL